MNWVKAFLFSAVLVAGMAGMASSARADYWRNHDGHWCFFHEGDKAWYYTDGVHWFSESNGRWRIYKFDREFGRKDFQMGDYHHPIEERKVVVPHHDVYRP